MTNIWQHKAQELTIWKEDAIATEKTKEIYNKAVAYLMQQYEKLDHELFNQFDGLTKIVWTTNRANIPCPGALGCAELGTTGGVYSLFYNDPRYDFFIMSMELAHRALAEYYVENSFSRPLARANNDVHYAANIMAKPWGWYYQQGFKVMSDWVVFHKPTYITIFMYDLRHILASSDKIMDEIKSGMAPSGTNPYWAAMADSNAKTEMLAWLGSYHTHDEDIPHH